MPKKEVTINEETVIKLGKLIDEAIQQSNLKPTNIELWIAFLNLTSVLSVRNARVVLIKPCTKSEPSYAM